jgi:hypothetical protein
MVYGEIRTYPGWGYPFTGFTGFRPAIAGPHNYRVFSEIQDAE